MRTGGKRGPVWLLAAANGISATGSLAAYTALTYEVYRVTGSPYWVSAAAFVSFALAGAAAPIAGWLADRYDRRRVMIGSDLAAAAVYLAAAALASSPAALIALTALGAAAQAPFRPASMAALPNVAAPEDLNWANGLLGSTLSAGIVAGPVVGGLLLSTTGASGAFLVNAGSFALSAAARRARARPVPAGAHRGAREGRPRLRLPAGAGEPRAADGADRRGAVHARIRHRHRRRRAAGRRTSARGPAATPRSSPPGASARCCRASR